MRLDALLGSLSLVGISLVVGMVLGLEYLECGSLGSPIDFRLTANADRRQQLGINCLAV